MRDSCNHYCIYRLIILVIFWDKNKQSCLSIYIIIIWSWYLTNLLILMGIGLTDFQETGKRATTKFGGFRNRDDVRGQSARHRRGKGTECRSHVPHKVKWRCPIPNTCKLGHLDHHTIPHPLCGPRPNSR